MKAEVHTRFETLLVCKENVIDTCRNQYKETCIILKVFFFFRKCDWFFRSPNLEKKNILKNYLELEI